MESEAGCAWRFFLEFRLYKGSRTGLWHPGLGEAKQRFMQGQEAGLFRRPWRHFQHWLRTPGVCSGTKRAPTVAQLELPNSEESVEEGQVPGATCGSCLDFDQQWLMA